jgi:uncharacterized protein with FMN-binding domain
MFPKRGAVATVITVFLLVLLLNFKTPEPSSPADLMAAGLPADGQSMPAFSIDASPSFGPTVTAWPSGSDQWPTGSTPSAGAGYTQPPAGTSPGSTLVAPPPGGATGTPPAAPPPGSTRAPSTPGPVRTPAPTPAPPAAFSGSITGAVVQTKYGPMQVRVVYSGGRITDVVTLQMTNQSSHSTSISQRACPILRSEALKAQSAAIDSVSGATYTSNGYKASLQSAIDRKP